MARRVIMAQVCSKEVMDAGYQMFGTGMPNNKKTLVDKAFICVIFLIISSNSHNSLFENVSNSV